MAEKNNPKEPISVERQFENYLERVKLKKSEMSDIQYDETKKSFFAGASAMMVLFRTSIPDLPEAQAMVEMEKLWQEAEFFWKMQGNMFNLFKGGIR